MGRYESPRGRSAPAREIRRGLIWETVHALDYYDHVPLDLANVLCTLVEKWPPAAPEIENGGHGTVQESQAGT